MPKGVLQIPTLVYATNFNPYSRTVMFKCVAFSEGPKRVNTFEHENRFDFLSTHLAARGIQYSGSAQMKKYDPNYLKLLSVDSARPAKRS